MLVLCGPRPVQNPKPWAEGRGTPAEASPAKMACRPLAFAVHRRTGALMTPSWHAFRCDLRRATNPSTPPRQLARYLRHQILWIRAAAYLNPSTPASARALYELATDDEPRFFVNIDDMDDRARAERELERNPSLEFVPVCATHGGFVRADTYGCAAGDYRIVMSPSWSVSGN